MDFRLISSVQSYVKALDAKYQAARRLYARPGYHETGIADCNFNGMPGVKRVCLEKTLDA